VIVTYSPKFEQDMPLIVGIPNRSEIRIHWGNLPQQTDGCLLVGLASGPDFIGQSRLAFAAVWSAIELPARAGNCTILVLGGATVPQ
jgi:hypothetical protein